jgi:hypothetical protein
VVAGVHWDYAAFSAFSPANNLVVVVVLFVLDHANNLVVVVVCLFVLDHGMMRGKRQTIKGRQRWKLERKGKEK